MSQASSSSSVTSTAKYAFTMKETPAAFTLSIYKQNLTLTAFSFNAICDPNNLLCITVNETELFKGTLSHPVEKTRFTLQVFSDRVEIMMPKKLEAAAFWGREF